MKMKLSINTKITIKSKDDLKNLKLLVEVNQLEKPNFSELGRELGVDRRTVKKYYEGNTVNERKQKKSKLDDYYDIVKSLLSA